MYDRTGLSTKCTLMKTGFKNLRTGTKANFRPFVDALENTLSDMKSVKHDKVLAVDTLNCFGIGETGFSNSTT